MSNERYSTKHPLRSLLDLGYLLPQSRSNSSYFNSDLPNRSIDLRVGNTDSNNSFKTSNSGMWGAILNGIASVGSGIAGIFTANSARKAASREAQKQRDWQEMMYNRSNEYNAPSQQLQRYKEAGLNPNLVFGQGGSSLAAQFGTGASATGNVSTTPQFGDSLKGLGDALMLYQQYKQTQSNIALQRAQIRTEETKQRLNEANANKSDTEAVGQDWRNNFNKSTEEMQKDILSSQRALNNSIAGLNDQQKQNLKLLRGQIRAQTDYFTAASNNLDADGWYKWRTMDERIKQVPAQTMKLIADAWYAKTMSDVAKAKLPYEINELIFDVYIKMRQGELLDWNLGSKPDFKLAKEMYKYGYELNIDKLKYHLAQRKGDEKYEAVPFLRGLTNRNLEYLFGDSDSYGSNLIFW